MAWWFYVTSPLQCLFWFFRFFVPKNPEESRQRLLQNIHPTGEVDGSYRKASGTSCRDEKENYNALGKNITNKISYPYEVRSQGPGFIASSNSEEYEPNIRSSVLTPSEEPIQLHSNDDIVVNDNSHSLKETKITDVDHLNQEASIMNQDNFSLNSSENEITGFSNLKEQGDVYVARSSVGFGKLELITRMLTEQISSEDYERNQMDIHIDFCACGPNENVSEPAFVSTEKHHNHHKDLIDNNNTIAKSNTGIKLVGAIMKNTLTMKNTEVHNIKMEVVETGTCENGEVISVNRKILTNEREKYSTSHLEQDETTDKTRIESLHENTMNNNVAFHQPFSLEMNVINAVSNDNGVPDTTVTIVIGGDLAETPVTNGLDVTDPTSKNEFKDATLTVFTIEDSKSEISFFEDKTIEHEPNKDIVLHLTDELSLFTQETQRYEAHPDKEGKPCDNESYDSASYSDSTCKFSDAEKEMKREKLYSHKDGLYFEYHNSEANGKFVLLADDAEQASSSALETQNEKTDYDLSDLAKETLEVSDTETKINEVATYLTPIKVTDSCNSEIKFEESDKFMGAEQASLSSDLIMQHNINNQRAPDDVGSDESIGDLLKTASERLEPTGSSLSLIGCTKQISNPVDEIITLENHKNDFHKDGHKENATTVSKNFNKNYKSESNLTCDEGNYNGEKLNDSNAKTDDENHKNDSKLQINYISDYYNLDKVNAYLGNIATDNLSHEMGVKMESNSASVVHKNDKRKAFESNATCEDKNYEYEEKFESNSFVDAPEQVKEKVYEDIITIKNQNYVKEINLESSSSFDVTETDQEKAFEDNVTIDNKNCDNEVKLGSSSSFDIPENYQEKAYEDNVIIGNKNCDKEVKLQSSSSLEVPENDQEKAYEDNVTIDHKNYDKEVKLESSSPFDVPKNDQEKAYEDNLPIGNKNCDKEVKLESSSSFDVPENDQEKAFENNVTIDNKNCDKEVKFQSSSSFEVPKNDQEKAYEDNVTVDNKNYDKEVKLESSSPFDVPKIDQEKAYEDNLTIDNKNGDKKVKLESSSSVEVPENDQKEANEDNVTIDNKNDKKEVKLESSSFFDVPVNDKEKAYGENVTINDKNFEKEIKLESSSSFGVPVNDKEKAYENNATIDNKNFEKEGKLESSSTFDIPENDQEREYKVNVTIGNRNYEKEVKLENNSISDAKSNEIRLNNSNDKFLILDNHEILFCNLNSQTKEVAFDGSVAMNLVLETANKFKEDQEETLQNFVSHKYYDTLIDEKCELEENEFNVFSTSFSSRLIQVNFDENHMQEFRNLESDLSKISQDRKLATLFNIKDINFDHKTTSETNMRDTVIKISSPEYFTGEQKVKAEFLEPPDQGKQMIEVIEKNELVENRLVLCDSTEEVSHTNDKWKEIKVNDEFLNLETVTKEYKIETLQSDDSIVESVNKEHNLYPTSKSPDNAYGLNEHEVIEFTSSESSKIMETDIKNKQPSNAVHLSPLADFLELENENLNKSLNNSSEETINTMTTGEMDEQVSQNSKCIKVLNKTGTNSFQNKRVAMENAVVTNLICETVTGKSDEVNHDDSSSAIILQNSVQQESDDGSNFNCESVILDQVVQDAEVDKREDLNRENDSDIQNMNNLKVKDSCESKNQEFGNHLPTSMTNIELNDNPKIKDQKNKVTELMLEASLISNPPSKMELDESDLTENEIKIYTNDFSCYDSENELQTLVIREHISAVYEQSDDSKNAIAVKSDHNFRGEEESMVFECLHEGPIDSCGNEKALKRLEDGVIEEFLNKAERINSTESDMPLRRRNKVATPPVLESETNIKEKRRGLMGLLYNEEEMEVDEILIKEKTIFQKYDDFQETSISSEKRVGNVLFSSSEIRKDSLDEPIMLEDSQQLSESKNKRQGFIRLSSSDEFQSFNEFLLSDKDQIAMEKKIKFSKKGEIQRPIEKTPPFDFINQKFFCTTTNLKLHKQQSALEAINTYTRNESTNEPNEYNCSLPSMDQSVTKETARIFLPLPALSEYCDTEKVKESADTVSTPMPEIDRKDLIGKVPSIDLEQKPVDGLSQIIDALQVTECVDSAPPANEMQKDDNKHPVGGVSLVVTGGNPNVGAPLFAKRQKTDTELITLCTDSLPPNNKEDEAVTKMPMGIIPLLGLGRKPNIGASLFASPRRTDTEQDTECSETKKHDVPTKKSVGGVPLFGLGNKPPIGGIPMFPIPQKKNAHKDTECSFSAPSNVELGSKLPIGGVSLFRIGHQPVGGVQMFALPKQISTENDSKCFNSASSNIVELESVRRKTVGGVPLFGLGHKPAIPLLHFEDKKIPVGGVKLFGGSELTEKLKGRREKLKEDTPSSLVDNESGYSLPPNDALSKHYSSVPQYNSSPKRKPVGGVPLFGGNEFQEKLKARRGKLSAEDDDCLSQLNKSKNTKNKNDEDLHNNLTSDDKSVEYFFQRFDSISKIKTNANDGTELFLEDLDQERNCLEHVNKSRPKGPLNRRPRQTNSRKEGKNR